MIYLIVNRDGSDYAGQDVEDLVDYITTDINDNNITSFLSKENPTVFTSFHNLLCSENGSNFEHIHLDVKYFKEHIPSCLIKNKEEYDKVLNIISEYEKRVVEYKVNKRLEKEKELKESEKIKLERDRTEYERLKKIFDKEV